ncbi:MAG: Cys-tRNA(Pro) deacylase [Lachnospiraceae bacterium]|nr:Cys-tRNA(Pro) deacylase [Lachnospiraceae bacterium]
MAKEKDIKTNAMRILEQMKIPYEAHTYECKEFIDGVTLADQLGIPHEMTYKTLVTIGKSKNYYVFVIPIEEEIDMKKAAKVVNEKSIEMIHVKDINAITGYIRGCCTAIGMKKQFPTVIHESCNQISRIIVSGGKLGVQLELEIKDYVKACRGKIADVCVER